MSVLIDALCFSPVMRRWRHACCETASVIKGFDASEFAAGLWKLYRPDTLPADSMLRVSQSDIVAMAAVESSPSRVAVELKLLALIGRS